MLQDPTAATVTVTSARGSFLWGAVGNERGFSQQGHTGRDLIGSG